jgi:putative cell wall-binding protein
MKNKVMQKALSWVLSAAMVGTMSGAIPAMATSVYAGTLPELVTNSNTTVPTTGKVAFGEDSDKGVIWDVKSTKGNVITLLKDTAVTGKAYSSTYGTDFETTYIANKAEQAAIAEAKADATADGDETVISDFDSKGKGYNYADLTAPKLDATSVYVPSYSELKAWAVSSTNEVWTRDSVRTGTDVASAPVNSDFAGAYVSATEPWAELTTATAGTKTTSAMAYLPAVQIDQSKAWLKSTSDDGTVYYSFKDTSVPDVSWTFDKSTDTATVSTKFDASKYNLYWIGTSNAYTASDATVYAYQQLKLTNGKATLSGADKFQYNYLFLESTATGAVTRFTSTPTLGENTYTPDASNFTLDDSNYTYKGDSWRLSDFVGMIKPATDGTDKTDTSLGDCINGKQTFTYGTDIKNIKVYADDSYTTPLDADKIVDAGIYYLQADVAEGVNLSNSKKFTAATVNFGPFVIHPRKVYADDITFTLAAREQFEAQASLQFTVDALKITTKTDVSSLKGDSILPTDTVNVKAVVTYENSTATDVTGTFENPIANGKLKKIVLSSPDNKNYQIYDPMEMSSDAEDNFVVYDSRRESPSPLVVEGATLKSVTIKYQPYNTYIQKGDTFDPAGLVITGTTTNGATFTVPYNESPDDFKFTPDKGFKFTSVGEKEFSFTYKGVQCADKIKVTATTTKIPVQKITASPEQITIATGEVASLPEILYSPFNANYTTGSYGRVPIYAFTTPWTVRKKIATMGFGYNDIASLVDSQGAYSDRADSDPNAVVDDRLSGKVVTGIKGLKPGTTTLYIYYGVSGNSTDGYTYQGSTAVTITVTDKNSNINYLRIAGNDRYETSVAMAEQYYQYMDNGNDTYRRNSAILVTGENFADALTASSLAGVYEEPIFLTTKDTLSTVTANEIKKKGITSITIVGGPAAVSDNVVSSLRAIGVDNVNRVYGDDRRETAENVYQELGWNYDTVVIATGDKASDAISISPWAYSKHYPMLLATDGKLTGNSTKLAAKATKIYVVGGVNAVSNETIADIKAHSSNSINVIRFDGADRYDTSAKICKYFASSMDGVGIASGDDSHYSDALVGAELMGLYGTGAPILLVDGTSSASMNYINSEFNKTANGINTIAFLGGTAAVSQATEDAILSNWSSKVNVTNYFDYVENK